MVQTLSHIEYDNHDIFASHCNRANEKAIIYSSES